MNQKYYLQNIIEHSHQINESSQTLNHLETVIGDDAGNAHNAPIFVKYSPLLDPIRYLSGKYNINDTKTMTLPKYNSSSADCEEKMLNVNNASYVDGFFSYLTSKTLHTHGVVHGLDYYGSYLCKQREFSTNVFDDIEYLVGCSFFNTYENELFTIDYSQFGEDESDLSDINVSKLMKLRNKLKPMIGSAAAEGDDESNSKNKLHILDTVVVEECDSAATPIESECVVIDTPASTASTAPEMVELNVEDLMMSQSQQDGGGGGETKLNHKDRTRDQDYSSDSDSSQSNSSYTTIDAEGEGEGEGEAMAMARATSRVTVTAAAVTVTATVTSTVVMTEIMTQSKWMIRRSRTAATAATGHMRAMMKISSLKSRTSLFKRFSLKSV